MVHEYRDVAAVTGDASLPSPQQPAIAAFTPHLDGKLGVTIAEYAVDISAFAPRKHVLMPSEK